MQAVGAASAGAIIQRRGGKMLMSTESTDAEESEIMSFERDCQLLNTQQYKGFRRFQVEVWLLFEDQTSSTCAAVRAHQSPALAAAASRKPSHLAHWPCKPIYLDGGGASPLPLPLSLCTDLTCLCARSFRRVRGRSCKGASWC